MTCPRRGARGRPGGLQVCRAGFCRPRHGVRTIHRTAHARAAPRDGKRILVAEDDPDNRRIVVKVLTREGYETLEADDGRSALALARRERPDLIVMDLGMPGMDG